MKKNNVKINTNTNRSIPKHRHTDTHTHTHTYQEQIKRRKKKKIYVYVLPHVVISDIVRGCTRRNKKNIITVDRTVTLIHRKPLKPRVI